MTHNAEGQMAATIAMLSLGGGLCLLWKCPVITSCALCYGCSQDFRNAEVHFPQCDPACHLTS